MKAAFLPDQGVVKVTGEDARKFLNGLVTIDVSEVSPGQPRFAALLTPQGKIIADFIIVETASAEGGGFFLDCSRAVAPTLVQRLNLYRLRAKLVIEDLSEILGVMAVWGGAISGRYGLCYADPRLPELGTRCMLPPHRVAEAAVALGADLVEAALYAAHRVALGVPQGGLDFHYGDAFPHESDMDQLGGVDFDKGCFVGQEVVSRMQHRGSARSRVVPVAYEGSPVAAGMPVSAGEKTVGTLGSLAHGRGLALLRLDRVGDALAAGQSLRAGGAAIRLVKPTWARFAFPGDLKAAQ